METLTEENKKNLLILADGIEGIPDEFFHMRYFREISNHLKHDLTDCGTVGCALGWGPFIKGLKPIVVYEGQRLITFGSYCREYFCDNSSGYWYWCFSQDWRDADNTAFGAALRIRELVENGLPSNWEEQMEGDAPYMFAEALEA